ncbi:MAG: hypothetical protein ACQGVK_17530 [Myxococcota bacterium]
MSATWLIAIDDTDNLESIGTGRLARMLGDHLVERGALDPPTITRHQLLVHPDIPYTTHNSSACLSGQGGEDAGDRIVDLAWAFLDENFHEGANPGLCVARADAVPGAAIETARRAQREVLALSEFDRDLAEMDLRVRSAGETGQGRIGACAGVALRSTGDDGRFIGLGGIRDLRGALRVSEICARSGVERVVDSDGRPVADDELVETRDWVRPSLRGGAAVLVVKQEGGRWTPVEQRTKDD